MILILIDVRDTYSPSNHASAVSLGRQGWYFIVFSCITNQTNRHSQ